MQGYAFVIRKLVITKNLGRAYQKKSHYLSICFSLFHWYLTSLKKKHPFPSSEILKTDGIPLFSIATQSEPVNERGTSIAIPVVLKSEKFLRLPLGDHGKIGG